LPAAAEPDPDAQALYVVFRQALQQLGWTEGRNVRYEYRSRYIGNVDLSRRNVAELVALGPDVILVGGAINVEALQRTTRTIPIVFAGLTDPVGAGFVESLARPRRLEIAVPVVPMTARHWQLDSRARTPGASS
jgi:putative ABC transport system substrate-binding protein